MPPVVFKPPKPVQLKAFKGPIPAISDPQLFLGKTMVAGCAVRLKTKALEELRNNVKAKLGRKKELSMKVFATYPITRKPDGVKQGQGKGEIETFCARVPHGGALLNVPQMSPFVDFGVKPNFYAFRHAAACLPVKTYFRSSNSVYSMDRLPDIQANKSAAEAAEKDIKTNFWFKNREQHV